MKKIKLIPLLSAILAMAVSLSGCGGKADVVTEPEKEEYKIEYTESIDDLERGQFYVQTPHGFAKPYWGNTSFGASGSATSSERVAWFMDDFDMIPTLYEGDMLVYRTNVEFTETFQLERFLDEGYTVGICNLKRTSSGRYKLATSVSAGTLNPASDAAKLIEFGDINVIIDAIDGKSIRQSNVTQSGTIKFLDKDKTYKVDLYVGTEIQDVTLVADSRALYSAQSHSISDYEFLQSEIIKIEIPVYLNTGYYNINGFGIFRYIKGDSYDENTDFNELSPTSMSEYERLLMLEEGAVNAKTEHIEILTPGQYEIMLSYGEEYVKSLLDEGQTSPRTPNASLNVGDEIIRLVYMPERTLKATFYAKAGVYDLDIDDLAGRETSYTLRWIGEYVETEEREESSEVAEENSGGEENSEDSSTDSESVNESADSSSEEKTVEESSIDSESNED